MWGDGVGVIFYHIAAAASFLQEKHRRMEKYMYSYEQPNGKVDREERDKKRGGRKKGRKIISDEVKYNRNTYRKQLALQINKTKINCRTI